jgi:hypothetical protein
MLIIKVIIVITFLVTIDIVINIYSKGKICKSDCESKELFSKECKVNEPNQETTTKIVCGTLRKIEETTGVKWPYTNYLLEQVVKFLVNMTSEYKRVYENGSRYPDVSLSLFSKCFTYARFENSKEVHFKHIYEAIKNTNLVYDDVIKKELPIFKEKFGDWLAKEGVNVE